MGKPFPPEPYVRDGVYRHFKTGDLYLVYGGGWEVDSEEIYYRVYYRDVSDGRGNRRVENFFGHVEGNPDRPDYTGPRFVYVNENIWAVVRDGKKQWVASEQEPEDSIGLVRYRSKAQPQPVLGD